MALVSYSDSESDSDPENDTPIATTPPRKRLRRTDSAAKPAVLPPLPTGFHDLYASSTRISVRDDPSLHGGRKRVIPHVEGNWPTHIYLEWYPQRDELAVLNTILAKCGTPKAVHSLLRSDLGVQLPLHISLSRPVVLATEQKQPFTDDFERAVQESSAKAFNAVPEGLDWVSNTENTRWFLVMRIKRPPQDQLNTLLRISNQTLTTFGQPPLYAPKKIKHPVSSAYKEDDFSDRFHISLAWSLTAPSIDEQTRISGIDLKPLEESLRIEFNSVKVKIGNVVKSLALERAM
ncbi:U6 snRNA phosphodiesterase [Talaromyces islandicus]|uniref:U6 snRNA phosphodiesterase n=1 Tax=Talaromyces islandicus TaxID=28573 RepID=A0A0U1M8Z8_TALIS|nr:U6 snRNA phosphodiesterase [Talaromyces islandicus]